MERTTLTQHGDNDNDSAHIWTATRSLDTEIRIHLNSQCTKPPPQHNPILVQEKAPSLTLINYVQ